MPPHLSDTDRGMFARSVFGILGLQTSFVAATNSLFYFVPSISHFARESSRFQWVSIGLFIFEYMLQTSLYLERRRPPLNYFTSVRFTVFECLAMGSLAAIYGTPEVMVAYAVTALVFFSLSLFTFQNKLDFTLINTVWVILTVVAVAFGIMFAVRQDRGHVSTVLAVLIFCHYALIDVDLMLRRRHLIYMTMSDILFAAFNVYIDIAAWPLYFILTSPIFALG